MYDFIATYVFVPVAEAAGNANVGILMAKINKVIINPLITLMFVIAFIVFVWGLFSFFQAKSGSGSDGGIEQGKQHVIWGIIGMVVMVSVFGIMQFLINSLGIRGVDTNSAEIGNLSSSSN